MALTRARIIIISIVGIIILATILMIAGIIPGLRSTQKQDLTGSLAFWGVNDSKDAITKTLIAKYQAIHPGVAITYTQKNPATYESDLVNALAAGNGPDVFMIKNTWALKHADKLNPLTTAQYDPAKVAENFPKVVTQDFVLNGNTYAFPLYIDTLALYYNKDMFDNAGVATPPKTWEEFDALIPRLRSLDSSQKIVKAAAAIGGSGESVAEAPDLLTAKFLQSGVAMTDENLSEATFAGTDGEQALRSYVSYANPASPLYTWNDDLTPSLDSFAQETVAMMFEYESRTDILKEKSPFLNFAVIPMLQSANAAAPINYAQYWGLAVAKTSKLPSIAWDFAYTVTNNSDISDAYLKETKRSPALRSLISTYSTDAQTGFFATQALTAKSWHNPDASAVDASFSKMIKSVITGQLSADRALRTSEDEVTQLLKRAKGE